MGINFGNKTDISLAKVILQETEDSKRHIRGVVEAKNYFDTSNPLSELSELEKDPKEFSCGFICFSKYLFNLDLPISNYHIYENKLGYFINFRSYILYHIHSVKAYLHIRMNKKFQELEKKLNSTKILSDTTWLNCKLKTSTRPDKRKRTTSNSLFQILRKLISNLSNKKNLKYINNIIKYLLSE
jgi:hypothetical protein